MKKLFIVSLLVLVLGGTISSGVVAVATEVDNQGQNTVTDKDNDLENIVVYKDEDGSTVVRKYEDEYYNSPTTFARASTSVTKWGSWQYTNIAVSTGVLANAINAAFYAGGAAAISMFGIPGWAIAGLLGVTSWTEFGSAPGREIAKKWDTNKNGWVGFYMRKGYNANGKHVATEYKTK
ncbi:MULTISPECIES: hypothetical protein [Enterococcus]|uniref:Uncharacterized protein n=1 Tax=Enterococcus gallinarum TaxID=1353 RepID=A0AAE7T0A2_ENTGA|nr:MULTISPECIES: hypothetical protein [Enterococcus]MBM6742017.1 hypothetical protein [Enterococcus gallinarum]MCO5531665.1 hypothetical protein [Enterococcus faecium]MDT2714338.1 hypothetical protein [Enterococcus gallinarum]NQE03916.1 hypothetical protein [Enterococcus gallinarum]QOG26991.1 hypothetical protein EGM181_06905 [Enterococcus gallinarum]